jgi:hypothetical protein
MTPNSRSCHATCCGDGFTSMKFWYPGTGAANVVHIAPAARTFRNHFMNMPPKVDLLVKDRVTVYRLPLQHIRMPDARGFVKQWSGDSIV